MESTLGIVEWPIFRERSYKTTLMISLREWVILGALLKSRRPPGLLVLSTKQHWGSESDRGCSSETGWGRAIQTSGRVGGECEADGAKCSPRLCKLGHYDLSRGDNANPG